MDRLLGKLGHGAIPGIAPRLELFLWTAPSFQLSVAWDLSSPSKLIWCSPIQATCYIPTPVPIHTVLSWP